MFGDLNKRNPHFKDEYRAIKADAPPPKDPPLRGSDNQTAVAYKIITAARLLEPEQFLDTNPQAGLKRIQSAGSKLAQVADLVSPAFQTKYLRPWLADIQKMLATDDPGIWYQTARMLVYGMGMVSRPLRQEGRWPKGTEPKKSRKSARKADAPPPKDPPLRQSSNIDAVAGMLRSAQAKLDSVRYDDTNDVRKAKFRAAGAKLAQAADMVSPAFQAKYLRPWLSDIQSLMRTPGYTGDRHHDIIDEIAAVSRPMRITGKWPKGTEPKGN